MSKHIEYEDLPILPHLIAETICNRPYVSEFSDQHEDSHETSRVEALRQKMTPAQVAKFAGEVDDRCRVAHANNATWFQKIVRSKTNAGRTQLYGFITHWLHAYLTRRPRRKRST